MNASVCQSMENKGVCILHMNEDPSCNNFVNEILQTYSYQVLHSGDALTVLSAILKIKEGLGLVLTNAYLSEPGGDSVAQYIQSNIDLPIALMDYDESRMLPKGQTPSFTVYVIHGLRREEIAKLRDLTFQNAKGKMVATNHDENTQRATMPIAAPAQKDCPSVSESTGSNKRKGHADKDESGDDESPVQKKGRVHWSPEMHKKFLEAIELIGYDKAVPKKLVEIMNIPGLTRANIASHLQKYRESQKQETSLSSLYVNRGKEFKFSPFSTSNFTTRLNASRNSDFMQGRYHMPRYQQKPFVSHALNRGYLQPQKKFSFKPTTDLSYFLQSRPELGPKLQPNGNFRIYSDQTKNVLVSVNGGNAPNQTANQKFVGLKFTKEGNKIQFGENGFSQTQFTNCDQQNLIPEQNKPSTPSLFDAPEPYLLEDILAQHYVPQKNDNQVEAPITQPADISLEQHVLQPFGTYGDENTVSDQFHNDSLQDLLMNFENETIDTPSTLVPDEELLSPWLELLNNDTSTSTGGGSGQHVYQPGERFSHPIETDDFIEPEEIDDFIEPEEIDNVLQNGTGNTSSEFEYWSNLYNSLID